MFFRTAVAHIRWKRKFFANILNEIRALVITKLAGAATLNTIWLVFA
jgi:hypothetical protein